ncbi:hypothetical protein JCM10212_003135 [Sporobolomyces blumeae]
MVSLAYLAAFVLPALVAAAPQGQLYFAPPLSPPSSSSAASKPIVLTAPQTNAILAHHLGVSSYVDLPLSSARNGGRDWESALEVGRDARGPKMVVVLECPKQGCQGLIPDTLESTRYTLPSLPSHSYLSALSLHLHRLASNLHLDVGSERDVYGVKKVVEEGLKQLAGWQGWVGDELAQWIGYEQPKPLKTQVERPVRPNAGLLSDLDFLDSSADKLVQELDELANLADSFAERGQEVPKIVMVHLKGFKDVAAKHSASSQTYQTASNLLRSTLDATLSSFDRACASHSEQPKTVFLALAPPSTPILRKRQGWMKPFETGTSRYVARSSKESAAKDILNHNQKVKRSVFVSGQHGHERRQYEAEQGDEKKGDKKKIVPTSSRCFSSLDELNNLTASCLGHGEGIQGISTRGDAKECWVCQCGETTDEDGRKTRWAGEGCEKVDLSGSFSLLFFSSLGLILVLVASVALLYGIGTVELPGTLSSVDGGNGAGRAKRD